MHFYQHSVQCYFCQIEQLRRRRSRMFYYSPEMKNFCLNTICNIHFRFLVFRGSRNDATPLLLPAVFIILWSALGTWTRQPPSPCPVLYSPTPCPRIILFIDNFFNSSTWTQVCLFPACFHKFTSQTIWAVKAKNALCRGQQKKKNVGSRVPEPNLTFSTGFVLN